MLDQNLTGINQMIRPQLDLTYLKEYQNNLPNLGQAYNDTPVTLTDHGGGKSRQQFTFRGALNDEANIS